ncbi:hypothetical protein Micbo1qcDRAFT_179438 [Microdochium bolleyi]|uniref:Uncharacterized protein n=1 Tax=Microdochium bolleyi TaxID=196109 RepID=A0A136IPZ5_9PEZI|nr:hypothetical protein Micbo1qcDRAFT_179438 [Microdochium bolleyi]
MQLITALSFCLAAATTAVAAPSYDASTQDDGGVIVALFTDANDRDSRADFTIGKWNFEGFAEWPIHVISQEGGKAKCHYTGATTGGVFTIMGNGKVKVSPPQHIKDVNCVEL